MTLVRVIQLRPGDHIRKDAETTFTVSSIEWADSFIHLEKTARAMHLFVKEDDRPRIVHPNQQIERID